MRSETFKTKGEGRQLNQQRVGQQRARQTATRATLFVPPMTQARTLVSCCTRNAHQFHLSPTLDNEQGAPVMFK